MLNNIFSTSTSPSQENTLTMEGFQKMIDEFFPILLYGTAEFVKQGELYHCKETYLSPEYIVCHPSDLEQIKKLLPNRRLVHISTLEANPTAEHLSTPPAAGSANR